MWPDRRLCALLGIAHPILQAPMLGICTPALAAAVTAAGGLGAHACGALDAEAVQARIRAVKERTNGAFNMNFFVVAPDPAPARPDAAVLSAIETAWAAAGLTGALPDLPPVAAAPGPAVIDAIVQHAPAVVSFHFGVPAADDLDRIRRGGSKVLATATTVAEARALEAAGVDAIIAQGWEAGGHRGAHRPNLPEDGVGTMALVPQVVDAVSVPVIAAGGIGDARGIAAALALGASGVQMGSAFLRCPEAQVTPARRAVLGRAADTDTVFTDAVSGRVARGRRSAYATHMAPLAGRLPPFPAMYAYARPLLEAGAGAEDAYADFFLHGQAAGLSRALPAADLVRHLADETRAVLDRMAGRPSG
jgi:nitronate monooxygenase